MAPQTFVIAEAGVNHNGDVGRALAMVEAAVAAGADAIKFQTFRAEDVVTRSAGMADYQIRQLGQAGSQFDMLRGLELGFEGHKVLARSCSKAGIEFMSTPFSVDAVRMLVRDIGIRRVKIASGEITNAPLLLAAARARKPIILSTGMSSLPEIASALGVIAFGLTEHRSMPPSQRAFRAAAQSRAGRVALRKYVTLLHCTSEYPAAAETVNLLAMDTLSQHFGLRVGLSDHSQGIAISTAAVARGAAVIEKHFTLDRLLPGPDHAASLTPGELTALVSSIRTVELALGSRVKAARGGERKTKRLVRRSLVALRPIARGEKFTTDNLGTKRPGTGVAPLSYWNYLGRRARRAYAADQLIRPEKS